MDTLGYQNGHNGQSELRPQLPPIEAVPTLSDDLRRYIALLWHWTWLLLLVTLAGGALGYINSRRQTPIYVASATMLISESRTLNEYANILASERLAQTYSQLMTQQPVLEGVIERLGLELDPRLLKERVTVSVIDETQLLSVSVEDTDPLRAAQIANSLGIVFAENNQAMQAARYADSKNTLSAQLAQMDEQIRQTSTDLEALGDDADKQGDRDRLEANLALYRQIYANLLQSYESVRLAEIQSTSTVTLVEQASPALRPIRPNIPQSTFLAAVVGMILGLGIIVLIETLDDTVKGPTDVMRQLGLPILGVIARFDDDETGPIAAREPRSPTAEAFRVLRSNIQFASVDHPIHSMIVTSPSPKDGKSTIITNLSVVMAQSGRQVALVDADLRRPAQHKRLRLTNRNGLSDLFVQEKVVLDGALRETKLPGLFLVSSGGLPPNPSELVGSEKMLEILRQVKERCDLVLIDTPPVMAVTDASVLASRVDGVLLVIRPGETKLALAKQAIEQLRRSGARLLGVVLNDMVRNRSRYSYYYKGYYSYEYYYSEEGGRTKGKRQRKNKQAPESAFSE